jgi:hypothetical protein
MPFVVQKRDGYFTRSDEYFSTIQCNSVKAADAVVTRNISIGDANHKNSNFTINGRVIDDYQWEAVEQIQPLNQGSVPMFAGSVYGIGTSGATGPYPNPIVSLNPTGGIVIYASGATGDGVGYVTGASPVYSVDSTTGKVTISYAGETSSMSGGGAAFNNGAGGTMTITPTLTRMTVGSNVASLSPAGAIYSYGGSSSSTDINYQRVIMSSVGDISNPLPYIQLKNNTNTLNTTITAGNVDMSTSGILGLKFSNDGISAYGIGSYTDRTYMTNGEVNVSGRAILDIPTGRGRLRLFRNVGADIFLNANSDTRQFSIEYDNDPVGSSGPLLQVDTSAATMNIGYSPSYYGAGKTMMQVLATGADPYLTLYNSIGNPTFRVVPQSNELKMYNVGGGQTIYLNSQTSTISGATVNASNVNVETNLSCPLINNLFPAGQKHMKINLTATGITPGPTKYYIIGPTADVTRGIDTYINIPHTVDFNTGMTIGANGISSTQVGVWKIEFNLFFLEGSATTTTANSWFNDNTAFAISDASTISLFKLNGLNYYGNSSVVFKGTLTNCAFEIACTVPIIFGTGAGFMSIYSIA